MSQMMRQILSQFCGIFALLWMLDVLAASSKETSISTAGATALDPDETLFIFTRCMELHSSSGDGSDEFARVERIRNWTRWQFEEPEVDQQTSCFVRDLLTSLELLDASGGRFRSQQFMVQFGQYQELLNCSEDEVSKLAGSLEQYSELKDCDAVFHAFRESILPAVDVFRKLFWLDHESIMRHPNQSVFEYCENKFYSHKLEVWCAVRSYSIPEDSDFHLHMDCIFKGLRYFNRNGDLNMSEILRDFHFVGITHLDEKVVEILSSCTVDPEARALSYYKCLLESEFLEQFKQSLDYREIRSSNYFYTLVDEVLLYDKAKIDQKISDHNREFCPDL